MNNSKIDEEIDLAVFEVLKNKPRCMYCDSSDGHWEVLLTYDYESLHSHELWFCCHKCRDKGEPVRNIL